MRCLGVIGWNVNDSTCTQNVLLIRRAQNKLIRLVAPDKLHVHVSYRVIYYLIMFQT